MKEQDATDQLQDRLLAHLQQIVRERDPYHNLHGHTFVKAYLARELAQHGALTTHQFEHLGQPHENLVLDLLGQQERGFILVGAHYDAVPGSPGADDNGTALAVLLELARTFSMTPARSPIRLVAFDLEERNQSGSRAYAQAVRRRGEALSLMIALEMLGYRDPRPGSQRYPPGLGYLYPDRGDFIGLIGNLRTLPALWRLTRRMRDVVPCEFLAVPLRGTSCRTPDGVITRHFGIWGIRPS